MDIIKRTNHLVVNPSKKLPITKSSTPLMLRVVRILFGLIGSVLPNLFGRITYLLFTTPRVRAKHKRSDQLLEKAKIFEFLYGGQLLKGYEWGKGEKTVLLVHGWESRGTALRSFVPQLMEAGYRVVAFDGPAHGNSTGKRTNLPHFGGAVRAIINQIEGVEGIITHSFGGASTVFALNNMAPDIHVKKLVLIGVPNRMQTVLEQAVRTLHVPKKAARAFYKIISQKLGTSIEQADVSKANIENQVGEVLIVHDKSDPIVPFKAGQIIFETWDNARLLSADGLGHYQIVKSPQVVNAVVDFILE